MIHPLLQFLPALSHASVLCVGDVMLDKFVYGTVTRISPEAPIPVLSINRQTEMLGGAGNVSLNLEAFGTPNFLLSVTGKDPVATKCIAALEKCAQVEAHFLPDSTRTTSVKTRHIAGIQQLLRTDEESTAPLSPTMEKQLLTTAEDLLEKAAVLVLSDYGKGVLTDSVCQQLISLAKRKHRPIIVDPKGKDYSKYSGASYVTPNRQELELASGLPTETDAEIVTACRALLTRYDFAGVVATRSAKGMSLVLKSGEVFHIPTEAIKVFDVSGAGDTVIAMLAAALGAKASMLEAMQLANVAAGIVVRKPGTATASVEEITQALYAKQSGIHQELKIKEWRLLAEQIDEWRDAGLRVGFTNGCFDVLHTGHISLLAQAKAACDRLIVGVNTDASVKRLKGDARPMNKERDRAMVLAALEVVDGIILFGEDTPEHLIHRIRPDVLVKGADYTIETVVGAKFVQSYGGKVVLANLKQGYSTTGLIEKMRQG